MNDNLILLYLLQMYVSLIKLKKLVKMQKSITLRRWWVKPHIHRHIRDVQGGYQQVIAYFQLHNGEEFTRIIGMSVDTYNYLFNLLQRRLTRHGPRQPLDPALKLTVVLSFLHHGGSPHFFAVFYRIGRSTMFELIKEVCTIIVEVLKPIYFPRMDENSWLQIAHDYEQIWQMPNCLGALDGRHFGLRKPPHSGSLFYNYRHFFSLVLLATCDAHKRFTWFNLGDFGSVNDASIFNNSDLFEQIQNEELNIPRSRELPGSNINMPYFFIGDNIFALQKHLMKPYSRTNNMNYAKRVFNYRIKRARLTIECAFGILTSRWSILQKKYGFSLVSFETIIIALLCLHNMLITRRLEESNLDNEYYEYNNQNEEERRAQDADVTVTRQRDLLAQYFTSDAGSVPWQDSYI